MTMATIAGVPGDRQAAERKFYTRMALLLIALVFLGFAPSFYLRDVVPPYPRPNPTLPIWVLLHGGLFTLWMLIFVAQTQLIAAGRRDIHMKLGIVGMLLAVAIIPMMYLVTVWQVGRANQPPFTDPLTWTAIPLAVIPPYAFLVWTGWRRRREAQWHKRVLLSAAICVVMGPAIARLPIAPPTLVGMTVQLLLALLLFVPLFIWDRRSLGRIHPATWLGFSMGLVTLVPLILFWTGADWASVARHLPGI
jgi:hypothetical protein